MCGGTFQPSRAINRAHGLSPRVRGNRPAVVRSDGRAGSIPACAGEPRRVNSVSSCSRVYPRVCGGTGVGVVGGGGFQGLSPRVRGNPSATRPSASMTRSIPACAGEPPCTPSGPLSAAVYPRVCGGTPEPPTGPRRRRVYPRVCGGTHPGLSRAFTQHGLSPRVRGNPRRGPSDCRMPGSIPACAGEPGGMICLPTNRPVYPRVCGGTASRAASPAREPGLSPRVRGNP